MFFGSEDVVEEVLEKNGNHGVWSNSHVVSAQARPETSDAFVLNGLSKAVQKSRIW